MKPDSMIPIADKARRFDLMAKPQTTQEQKPVAHRGRGRPPKDEARDPQEVALSNLQYAMDRACAYIADGNNSVIARAARCARAGVPQAKVEKALQAMEDALADAHKGLERAYSAPEPKAKPERRVDLLA